MTINPSSCKFCPFYGGVVPLGILKKVFYENILKIFQNRSYFDLKIRYLLYIKKILYGKGRWTLMTISEADKIKIDRAAADLYFIDEDSHGNAVIKMYADYSDTNKELLTADNFNFTHDIVGIFKNIVRDKFPSYDFGLFVPRFAGRAIEAEKPALDEKIKNAEKKAEGNASGEINSQSFER